MIMGGHWFCHENHSAVVFLKLAAGPLQKQICNYVVTAGHFCDPDRKTRAFYLLLTDV